MNKRTIIGIILSGSVLAFLIVCISLFLLLESWVGTKEEICRVGSPDSTLDAVIVRTNPGAMSSYAYCVFIVPAGEKPEHKDKVLHGIRLHEMQVEWKGPRILEIHYGPSPVEISYFRESWSDHRHNLSVEIHLITPGGILHKPFPSKLAHAKALTDHDIDIESYKMIHGMFKEAWWPTETNPNFRIWIIDRKKELFYDIPAPPHFAPYEKEVTEDWSFEVSESRGERITYLAHRKDKSMSIELELPLKGESYDFSALRNSAGDEMLIFMHLSENVKDNGLFGYVLITK